MRRQFTFRNRQSLNESSSGDDCGLEPSKTDCVPNGSSSGCVICRSGLLICKIGNKSFFWEVSSSQDLMKIRTCQHQCAVTSTPNFWVGLRRHRKGKMESFPIHVERLIRCDHSTERIFFKHWKPARMMGKDIFLVWQIGKVDHPKSRG